NHHDRQPELGFRFDARDTRDAVHLVLDREGDLSLDFFRRQPFGFGVDLDLDWCYVGKGIDVQASERENSARHDQHRNDGYQQTLSIEESDEVISHWFGLLLAFALLQEQVVSFYDY